ncbi:MFS transporter, partial [Acinetobacter baumannii]|nr:MFS transporter [Acinetobacter baumannii]
HIPLKARLDTNIPIEGNLNVPVKTALDASVDVKNTLPVKIANGELKIPLSTMRLNRVLGSEKSQMTADQ